MRSASAPNPEAATFEAPAAGFQQLFNEGKAAELAANFLPDGELIDFEGNLYRGREELQDLFQRFFATYPGGQQFLPGGNTRPGAGGGGIRPGRPGEGGGGTTNFTRERRKVVMWS